MDREKLSPYPISFCFWTQQINPGQAISMIQLLFASSTALYWKGFFLMSFSFLLSLLHFLSALDLTTILQ